jgi:predicted SAM-dependent methyltransferase
MVDDYRTGWFTAQGAGGETPRLQDVFWPYVQGEGLDLGCGATPIHARAIRVDRTPRHSHLCGNVDDLHWFGSGVFDYVFASHVLEDFPLECWRDVLAEWCRVIHGGGYLCVAVPDHVRFRRCVREGQPDNQAHRHESCPGEVSQYLPGCMLSLFDRFHSAVDEHDYNVVVVARKY